MQSGTSGRLVRLLIVGAAVGLGPLILIGALIDAYFTQNFLRESVTVEGRVVGLKPVRGGRRHHITFAPVFRFPVEGSHPVTVVSNTSSNPPVFKPGDAVKVHYRKEHPEGAVIESFEQLWLGDLVFGCVGALFCGISWVLVQAARKRWRPAMAVADDGSGILRRS